MIVGVRAQSPNEYLLAAIFVVASALTAKLLQSLVALPDPAVILLLGVLCAAIWCGLTLSVAAAVATVLIYDFFFVEPIYTLTVAKPPDLVALIVFLVVAVLISNLTMRLRNQAGSLAEKAKTEAVIEASEDGLILLDPGGVVVHANEVACAILELERTSIVGRCFDDLDSDHPHYLRVRSAVRDLLAHPDRETDRVELTLFMRGRDHYFIMRPTAFRTADGSPGGLILALQDVTYLRDQEARREALIATLSHELRTPIASLSMAQELFARNGTNLTAAQRDLLEAIREDVVRLRDVAQHLLDLSRAPAMSIALERHQVELHDVVGRVIKIFTPQASEKGITVSALLPPGGLTVVGDETKLTWAVSNLLANGLRYTPPGGRVEVQGAVHDGNVEIAVSDTGPGIAPEQRERIFERFAQAPDSGEIGSAGLGLAIVRDIVQAHGGRIHVDTAIGRGSRFIIEIPRG
jgi:PAS domain S-box-containing protein